MDPQQIKPAEAHSPWEWLAVAALLFVVAIGIWAVYRAKIWREASNEKAIDTPAELIEHYQKLLDDGLLDPEEFARIKAQLETPALLPKLDAPRRPPNQPPDTSIQAK